MSIDLNTVSSGYNLSVINSNFTTLENYINSSLLHRVGNVNGEAQMKRDLDLDGNNILNALVGGIPLSDIAEQTQAVYQALANGGYGYVTIDSFEAGNTLFYPNQVLRWQANGEYYRWDGGLGTFPKVVPAGSTPASTGGIALGAWVSVGDASLRPLVTVTANVVGSNNYTALPNIGGTVVAGNDYLYNNILYTTVGTGGTILSINDGVITTSGGSLFLLDKRWPYNDVRAWGVQDGVLADVKFKRAYDYLVRAPGGKRTMYVPPILLVLNHVELRDASNFNINFDGTYIVGTAATATRAVISVVNAVFFSTTGAFIIEAFGTEMYTYGMELTAGLPSLIAPLTGLLSNATVNNLRVRNLPCGVVVGDGSDLQISEIQFENLQSNYCNTVLEANGSQVIVSVTGNALSEPQSKYSYPKCVYRAIGATVYHNGGEVVASIDSGSAIARISQCSSALYGNPFGSVKVSGAHVECTGWLMYVENASGIVGSSDSLYSNVSFANCQGSMLNGAQELVVITVPTYSGRFAIDSTTNFYTSAVRSAKIVFSTSPTFVFDVASNAFRKGFGTLASEIGSGNVDWKHGMQTIMHMAVNPVTINNNTSVPLGFSTRASTGDYAFYYADTSSGGLVLAHKFDSLLVSIGVIATNALTISMLINGSEYFSCQQGGAVTIPREMLTAGTTITFVARNGSGSASTTSAVSHVIVSGSNRDL